MRERDVHNGGRQCPQQFLCARAFQVERLAPNWRH
jgi:hypothetical protein